MNPRLLAAAAVLLGGIDSRSDFVLSRPDYFGGRPRQSRAVAQIKAAGEVAPGQFLPQKQAKKNVNRPKIPRKRRFK